MEQPRESQLSHDPVELYPQASSQEVCLHNYTVTVLVGRGLYPESPHRYDPEIKRRLIAAVRAFRSS